MRSTCLAGWIILTLLTKKFYFPKIQYDWIACCYDYETFKERFKECEAEEINFNLINNEEKLRLIDVLRNFN